MTAPAGWRGASRRDNGAHPAKPTMPASYRHFSPRLGGHFPRRKRRRIFTYYGSLLPRFRAYSSSSPLLSRFSVVVRGSTRLRICPWRHNRQHTRNRPQLQRERAVNSRRLHAATVHSSREPRSPEFAPCPRYCGWVARLLRAVIPQPLLMRAGAAIRLLTKMIANVCNYVKEHVRRREHIRRRTAL